MRYLLMSLAALGILFASLALREHFRTDTSPCSINERWDCGIVNHSPFAVVWGVPVAMIGIAGYVLLGTLAFRRARSLLMLASLMGLSYSLYLAHVEARILGVWCIYCVASLVIISLISLLAVAVVVFEKMRSR